jgi:hypothetical protein
MKRYVKFSGDNCLSDFFTRNKPYKVVFTINEQSAVRIKNDNGNERTVMVSGGCGFLGHKESWVYCDKDGNYAENYKGQFDLADGDVKACGFNITDALNRIAERVG